MIFDKQNCGQKIGNLNVSFDSHLFSAAMDGDINRTFTGLQRGLTAFLLSHSGTFTFIHIFTFTFVHIYRFTFTLINLQMQCTALY